MSTRRYLVVPHTLERWAVQLGRTHIESFNRMEVAVAFAQRSANAADGDSNILVPTPGGAYSPRGSIRPIDEAGWISAVATCCG